MYTNTNMTAHMSSASYEELQYNRKRASARTHTHNCAMQDVPIPIDICNLQSHCYGYVHVHVHVLCMRMYMRVYMHIDDQTDERIPCSCAFDMKSTHRHLRTHAYLNAYALAHMRTHKHT
jgi:hypothetical protein